MQVYRVSRPIMSTLLAGVMAAVMTLSACSSTEPTDDSATQQAGEEAIVQEYSELNGAATGSGQQYLDDDLPADHVFTATTGEDAIDILKDGTGVVYFGFPECPWCRIAVPVMNEVAQAGDIDQIHYVDARELRDTRVLSEDGTVVIEDPGSGVYAELLEELGNAAPVYEGLNDPTQRRIYVPLVVAVKDGEVLGSHLSTVESQLNPFAPLTMEQHNELSASYADLFAQTR